VVTTTPLHPTSDDPLQELCVRLAAQRLEARIDVGMVAGERDVRLQVCQDDRPDVMVELLAPDPSTWHSRHWDAVRVQRGGRRVWRGPARGCPLDEVGRFVQALLLLGATQLAQLYVDLG
jgi:hypothetical protein